MQRDRLKLPRWGWALIVFIGLSILGLALGPPRSASTSLKAGDRVALFRDGVERVFIATTDGAWEEMNEAVEARSPELLMRLSEQGKLLMPKTGTKATVIKIGLTSVRVLLTNGEFATGEGWVSKDYVVRLDQSGHALAGRSQ